MNGHAARNNAIFELLGTSAVLLKDQEPVDAARTAFYALLAENQRLREALRLVSIWADDEGARMPVALVAFAREALAGDTE